MVNKDETDENAKKASEIDVFVMLTKTYANGLVIPGTELLAKLDEQKKKNAEVVKDIVICTTNYSTFQKEHDRLVKTLEDNQGQGWKTEDNQGQDDNEQT